VTQKIKPRRTLGLKLLLGATLIVIVLMSSAFLLAYNFLSEETSSFTFEAQTNQARMLGQQFSSSVDSASQILKLLPNLDEKTTEALRAQKKIENLQVFSVSRTNDSLKNIYSWGSELPQSLPESSTLKELEKSGLSYQAIQDSKGSTGVYLFTILDSRDAESKFYVMRARLNLESLQKSAGGLQTFILNRSGQVLLDTKNSLEIGSALNPENPLLSAAKKSPISVGTLEYQLPETGERHLGTFILPGYNILVLSTIKYRDAMRGTFMLLEKMLLVGMALLGASLVVVVIFSVRLTKPLAQLTEATHVISSGNFDLKLKEDSADEIGILSHSMNQMSRKIKELLLESIEKVKIEQEVAIASNLQQNLIPPSQIDSPKYVIRSHYQSAKECGGDWWGYVETEKDLTLLISDATGHGLPPAMLTAAAHGCFSAIQKILGEFPDLKVSPSKLLEIVNQVIVNSAKSELNMTMFVATYDFDKKTLTYSNAGHNNPWILRDRASKPKFESLKARGTRLGERSGFTPSPDVTIDFSEEDLLFLYTDGLLENVNQKGEGLGKDHLRGMLSEASQGGIDRMMEVLNQDLSEFYRDLVPEDDVTCVIFGNPPLPRAGETA